MLAPVQASATWRNHPTSQHRSITHVTLGGFQNSVFANVCTSESESEFIFLNIPMMVNHQEGQRQNNNKESITSNLD